MTRGERIRRTRIIHARRDARTLADFRAMNQRWAHSSAAEFMMAREDIARCVYLTRETPARCGGRGHCKPWRKIHGPPMQERRTPQADPWAA